MTRVRLRAAHPPAMLALLYARPHSHDQWPDHKKRVQVTIELARELIETVAVPVDAIADLSCGDATIARTLAIGLDLPPALYLGDLAPGYSYHGPIEETLHLIPPVDLLICTETIEHLDDPDAVLALARTKADLLVLSTPLDEFHAMNPQHYWGWDKDEVRVMLVRAGWEPVIQRDVTWVDRHDYPWSYQIWGCQ